MSSVFHLHSRLIKSTFSLIHEAFVLFDFYIFVRCSTVVVYLHVFINPYTFVCLASLTVAPITSSSTTPRITRSNSIPANEGSYDLYASSPLGSSMSLADRPKSMMRSGSFREPGEDGESFNRCSIHYLFYTSSCIINFV